jgi:hypothetical protein
MFCSYKIGFLEIIANFPYCKAEKFHLGANFLINASQKDFCY